MRIGIVVGLSACAVAAVSGFGAGAPLLGYSAVVGGLGLLAIAAEHARPCRWTAGESERGEDE